MSMQVVRNLASERTHVMDVEGVTRQASFGAEYDQPNVGKAVCGVNVILGVIMRSGTRVRCSACKHVSGIEVQP